MSTEPNKLYTAEAVRTVAADLKRRMDAEFGDYDPAESTYPSEVQRSLESLVDKADELIGWLKRRCA